ncbi:conserved protein of unknown function [Methylorubrum extorquens]|uniref:Uncharacterized protein n=1 Tax=Methylorubrum extorquens TaxID=408 RepID=A0A2N9AIE7_METEX|nr:hypothetical protein ASF59_09935 [Methylobacterium sp. Leaf121]SOR27137.1 conserved protein of unknown function [Methylorubrum extorquens]
MRTREDLIARVLKNLGVLAAGQAPSDEDRAEVDDLIEPVCEKLFHDGVAKLNGDEIDDAAYLPLADIVAERAMVPFGIGGTRAGEIRAAAEQARTDLKLAYRVYDARPPMRLEQFWGRRGGSAPINSRGRPITPPEDIDLDVTVDGGRRG